MQLRSFLAFFQIACNDVYRSLQDVHGTMEYGAGNISITAVNGTHRLSVKARFLYRVQITETPSVIADQAANTKNVSVFAYNLISYIILRKCFLIISRSYFNGPYPDLYTYCVYYTHVNK